MDENTTSGNNALLMPYVRCGFLSLLVVISQKSGCLQSILLLILDVRQQSRGSNVHWRKGIHFANVNSCAADVAPSLVGRYPEFCALMKQQVSDVLAVHCIIRSHTFVAKQFTLPLYGSLKQGSATYGTRAGSGPPSKIIRPESPLQIVVQ